MEYGLTVPHSRAIDGGVETWGGPVRLTPLAPFALETEVGGARGRVTIAAGERVELSARFTPARADAAVPRSVSLDDAAAGWRSWSALHEAYDGEVVDAAFQLRNTLAVLDAPTRDLVVGLADRAAAEWTEPDSGLWEARDKERHYLSSKVLCGVAVDRAVQLAETLGAEDRVAADDERMWATIEVIEAQLGATGQIRRWADDPYGFVIYSFWLVECLALMAEEYDPVRGEPLGNLPQAFSHVGLINAAHRLTETRSG